MANEGNNKFMIDYERMNEFALKLSNAVWVMQLSYPEQCMIGEAIAEISRPYIEERMSLDVYKSLSSMVAEYRRLLEFYVEEAAQRKAEVEFGVEVIGRRYDHKLTIEEAVSKYIGKSKEEMEKYNELIFEIDILLNKKINEWLRNLHDLYEGKGSLGKLLNKNEEDYEHLKPSCETDAEWEVDAGTAFVSAFAECAAVMNGNVPDFDKKRMK